MKPVSLIILLIILAACTTTKLYTPSAANENKRTTATVEELKQGYDLYTTRCNKCHGLNAPESRTPEKWVRVLDNMAPQAKLTAEEKDLVYRYLVNY